MSAWFTPFFGTEVFLLSLVGVFFNALAGPHSHSVEGYMVGYALFGLLNLGLVAQLASIPWMKRLTRIQRVLWWTATVIYLLWVTSLVPFINSLY